MPRDFLRHSLFVVGFVTIAALAPGGITAEQGAQVATATRAQLLDAYGKLPLHFEVNSGQSHRDVKFLSRGAGYTLFLASAEAVLSLRSASDARAAVRLAFDGANAHPLIEGLDPQPGRSHYFIGNDPTRWRSNVVHYAKVKYRQVYQGVDVVYYGNQRQIEYDLIVAPGADPKQIALRISGAQGLEIDRAGNLVLHTAGGDLVQHKPVIYQDIAGTRVTIDGRYELTSQHHVSFAIGRYDTTQPLVIDPVLAYATYLGGSNTEIVGDIAVDASGNAYVTGLTGSTNFPTTIGAFDTTFGGGSDGPSDAFVSKLNPTGTALVYSTYLGGGPNTSVPGAQGNDRAFGIAVDSAGNAYVTGITGAVDFPTTGGAFQTTYGGFTDAFVTKLNPGGSALVYSTFLGSGSGEFATDIAVDASGNAYVLGETGSTTFPTTAGAFQRTLAGNSDAFVSKLNPAGAALVYSTYVGGTDTELVNGIAIDSAGNVYLSGSTTSLNFPVTAGVFQSTLTPGGFYDAFLTKLNTAGSALVYSTFLGGNDNEFLGGIAVDGSNNAYVTGQTRSANFPTTAGAVQTVAGGQDDAFVTKFNALGTALLYSTLLGGSNNETAGKIAVDASGFAYITGATSSTNFPTVAPIQPANGGVSDAFLAKITPSGSNLEYSTYLGGLNSDIGLAIAVDASGSVYLAGATLSSNFPTTAGVVQTTPAGGNDAFVVRIAGVPTAINDAYTTSLNVPLSVAAPGVLSNDLSNGGGTLTASLISSPTSGALTLNTNGGFTFTPATGFTGSVTFTYRATSPAGDSAPATVTINVNAQPPSLGPPTNLTAAIAGNTITLTWSAPTNSVTPTGYVLEGGVSPGEVLASIPTGSTATTFTFSAPTGAFYLRVHSVAGSTKSVASNEIRVFVNVPAPPSAPTNLLGLVNGSTLSLAWLNTAAGGAPAGLILDVTGSQTVSVIIPLSETFSFAGVPAGTYTFSLRAFNGTGSSVASNAVTLTFPGACSGVPGTPANFVATRSGNVLSLSWLLPPSGPAPTGYSIIVSGAFNGSVPVSGRSISGAVGAGTYTLSVAGTNACGVGAASPTTTVTVP